MKDGWIFKRGPRRLCCICSDPTAGVAEKNKKELPLCPRCRDKKDIEKQLEEEAHFRFKPKVQELDPSQIVLISDSVDRLSTMNVQDGVSSILLNGNLVSLTIQYKRGGYFVYVNGAWIKSNTKDGSVPSYDLAYSLAMQYIHRILERTAKDLIRIWNGVS